LITIAAAAGKLVPDETISEAEGYIKVDRNA
jgi:hypothetical protein